MIAPVARTIHARRSGTKWSRSRRPPVVKAASSRGVARVRFRLANGGFAGDPRSAPPVARRRGRSRGDWDRSCLTMATNKRSPIPPRMTLPDETRSDSPQTASRRFSVTRGAGGSGRGTARGGPTLRRSGAARRPPAQQRSIMLVMYTGPANQTLLVYITCVWSCLAWRPSRL